MSATLPDLWCQCCNRNVAIGVASIPGIPMSIAWCTECLEAGAIPMWAAVANTAMCGGLDQAAEWWVQVVNDTLAYFGVSLEDFNAMVTVEMVRFDAEEAAFFRSAEGGD